MTEAKHFGPTPEALKPEHVRDMPLHDVTNFYGTLGLMLRLNDTLETTGLAQEPQVQWAKEFGLMLHANDKRTNGHYADHILRVTLRVIEHYGIDDPIVVAGCLLHDGPEDHANKIVYVLSKERIEDESLARTRAFELLVPQVGLEVVEDVQAVTNPIILPDQDKLQIYAEHTRQLVDKFPRARVIKLSDFTDNAVGNHYTVGSKQLELDEKYVELYQVHKEGLFMPDSLVTGDERLRALNQLSEGQARALARIAMARSEWPNTN